MLVACGGGGGSEPEKGSTKSNLPPVANAGADQVTDELLEVTLQGSANDSDGSITSYSWQQTDGTSVELSSTNSQNLTFVAPQVTASTTLTFSLTATDNDGATNTDTVVVTVNNVNQSPSINAGDDQTVPTNTLVQLSALAEDFDGYIEDYQWQQLDGPEVSLSGISSSMSSFLSPDVNDSTQLSFRVTVTDNEGKQSSDDIIITVDRSSIFRKKEQVNFGKDITKWFPFDFDNDGDKDLISHSDKNNSLGLLQNLGGGNLTVITSALECSGCTLWGAYNLSTNNQATVLYSSNNELFKVTVDEQGQFSTPSKINLPSSYYDTWYAQNPRPGWRYPFLHNVVVQDIDKDNDLDLLITYKSETSQDFPDREYLHSLYRNTGNGFFESEERLAITKSVSLLRTILLVDINQDDHLDLIVATRGESTYTGENETKGTVSKLLGPLQENNDGLVPFIEHRKVYSVATGYITDDNLLDLVVTTYDDIAFWYENIGNGSFSTKKTIEAGSIGGQTFLQVVDFNGDGRDDVLVGSYDAKLRYYENQGQFKEAVILDYDIGGFSNISVFDLDNDGDQDIIGNTSYVFDSLWFENDTIVASNQADSPIAQLSAELNQAATIQSSLGKAPFAINNERYKLALPSSSEIIIDVTGGFSPTLYLYDEKLNLIHTLDETIDGHYLTGVLAQGEYYLDISADENSEDQIFELKIQAAEDASLTQVPATFKLSSKQALFTDKPDIVILDAVDIDADGDIDYLVKNKAHKNIFFYIQQQDASFVASTIIYSADSSSNVYFSASVAKINEDNLPDLIISDSDLNQYLAINLGNTQFNLQIATQMDDVRSVAFADVNKDGLIDMAIAGYDINNNAQSALYLKNSAGSYQAPILLIAEEGGSSSISPTIEIMDIDGDGDMDLVTIFTDRQINIHEQLDGLSFITYQLDPIYIGDKRFVDLDNDGDLDFVYFSYRDPVAVGKSTLYWRENIGQQSFAESKQLLTTTGDLTSSYFEDIDGDDLPEIILALNPYPVNGYTALYHNLGKGEFSPKSVIPHGEDFYQSYDWATSRDPHFGVLDLDNNGSKDVYFGSEFTGKTFKLINQNTGTVQLIGDDKVLSNSYVVINAKYNGHIVTSQWSVVMGPEVQLNTTDNTVGFTLPYTAESMLMTVAFSGQYITGQEFYQTHEMTIIPETSYTQDTWSAGADGWSEISVWLAGDEFDSERYEVDVYLDGEFLYTTNLKDISIQAYLGEHNLTLRFRERNSGNIVQEISQIINVTPDPTQDVAVVIINEQVSYYAGGSIIIQVMNSSEAPQVSLEGIDVETLPLGHGKYALALPTHLEGTDKTLQVDLALENFDFLVNLELVVIDDAKATITELAQQASNELTSSLSDIKDLGLLAKANEFIAILAETDAEIEQLTDLEATNYATYLTLLNQSPRSQRVSAQYSQQSKSQMVKSIRAMADDEQLCDSASNAYVYDLEKLVAITTPATGALILGTPLIKAAAGAILLLQLNNVFSDYDQMMIFCKKVELLRLQSELKEVVESHFVDNNLVRQKQYASMTTLITTSSSVEPETIVVNGQKTPFKVIKITKYSATTEKLINDFKAYLHLFDLVNITEFIFEQPLDSLITTTQRKTIPLSELAINTIMADAEVEVFANENAIIVTSSAAGSADNSGEITEFSIVELATGKEFSLGFVFYNFAEIKLDGQSLSGLYGKEIKGSFDTSNAVSLEVVQSTQHGELTIANNYPFEFLYVGDRSFFGIDMVTIKAVGPLGDETTAEVSFEVKRNDSFNNPVSIIFNIDWYGELNNTVDPYTHYGFDHMTEMLSPAEVSIRLKSYKGKTETGTLIGIKNNGHMPIQVTDIITENDAFIKTGGLLPIPPGKLGFVLLSGQHSFPDGTITFEFDNSYTESFQLTGKIKEIHPKLAISTGGSTYQFDFDSPYSSDILHTFEKAAHYSLWFSNSGDEFLYFTHECLWGFNNCTQAVLPLQAHYGLPLVRVTNDEVTPSYNFKIHDVSIIGRWGIWADGPELINWNASNLQISKGMSNFRVVN